MNIFGVYQKLFKVYGPQGWWPILVLEQGIKYSIPYRSLSKYRASFRDPYFEIAVGAILTQSTAWKNVAIAINNLYNAKVLTPNKISRIKTARLQTLIRPAGYYKQKAKKLKIFSDWLVKNYNGDITRLKRCKASEIREKLLTLWGIGPETADSIILYALNKPLFVIDEYTRRLCKKYSVEFKEYDGYREFFEKKLPKNNKIFQEYHALIVASGKDKHTKI